MTTATVDLLPLLDRLRHLEEENRRLRDENSRLAVEQDKVLDNRSDRGTLPLREMVKCLEIRVSSLDALRYGEKSIARAIQEAIQRKLTEDISLRKGMSVDHNNGDWVLKHWYFDPL